MAAHRRRNAIHPGYVKSQNDGDVHYVGFAALVKLYGLNPADCFLWDPHLEYDDYRHFYPRYDGQYAG